MTAGVATAQTAPAAAPAFPVAFNVGVWSQYIFRAACRKPTSPAIQGRCRLRARQRAYVGVWGSNIEWLRDFGISSGRVELDIYGGYQAIAHRRHRAVDVGFPAPPVPGQRQGWLRQSEHQRSLCRAVVQVHHRKYSHALSTPSAPPNPSTRRTGTRLPRFRWPTRGR
ncbi:MAG: hypothetical protein IPM02_16765 [Betaproteobacteria bacterium]|nr:hypothetical protein [Betaproteobacteria bacterium]